MTYENAIYQQQERWIQQISKGYMDDVLSSILTNLILDKREKFETIQTRLSHLKIDNIRAVISYEQLTLERNKISEALLETIRSLLPEDFNKNGEYFLDINYPIHPDDYPCPDHPYLLGLSNFEEKHARIFFGRNAEIVNIFEKLGLYNSAVRSQILHLTGQSGVGKSSLLRAGLFPRLKSKGWGVDIVKCNSILQTIEAIGNVFKSCQHTQNNNLLILDQLEVIFINTSESERQTFLTILSDLCKNLPKLCILLTYREEYRAKVEDLFKNISGGISNSVDSIYIKPLNREGIIGAITGPWKSTCRTKYNLKIDEGVPELIATELLAHDDQISNIGPLLQITLSNMWEHGGDRGKEGITLTKKIFNKIYYKSLDDFFDKQLESEEVQNHVRTGLIYDLLFFYCNEKHGSAVTKSYFEIQSTYEHIDSNELTSLVEYLQSKWLLIEIINKNENGVVYKGAILAHDTLAQIVVKKYYQSEKPGQIARKILEIEGKSLTKEDLKIIEFGRKGMRSLTEREEKRIIEAQKSKGEDIFREKAEKLALEANKALKSSNPSLAARLAEFAFLADEHSPEARWVLLKSSAKIRWTRELQCYGENSKGSIAFSKNNEYLLVGTDLYHVHKGFVRSFKGQQAVFAPDGEKVLVFTKESRETRDFNGQLLYSFPHHEYETTLPKWVVFLKDGVNILIAAEEAIEFSELMENLLHTLPAYQYRISKGVTTYLSHNGERIRISVPEDCDSRELLDSLRKGYASYDQEKRIFNTLTLLDGKKIEIVLRPKHYSTEDLIEHLISALERYEFEFIASKDANDFTRVYSNNSSVINKNIKLYVKINTNLKVTTFIGMLREITPDYQYEYRPPEKDRVNRSSMFMSSFRIDPYGNYCDSPDGKFIVLAYRGLYELLDNRQISGRGYSKYISIRLLDSKGQLIKILEESLPIDDDDFNANVFLSSGEGSKNVKRIITRFSDDSEKIMLIDNYRNMIKIWTISGDIFLEYNSHNPEKFFINDAVFFDEENILIVLSEEQSLYKMGPMHIVLLNMKEKIPEMLGYFESAYLKKIVTRPYHPLIIVQVKDIDNSKIKIIGKSEKTRIQEIENVNQIQLLEGDGLFLTYKKNDISYARVFMENEPSPRWTLVEPDINESNSVVVTPDGFTIADLFEDESKIRIWSRSEYNTNVMSQDSTDAPSVKFSPDGNYLLSFFSEVQYDEQRRQNFQQFVGRLADSQGQPIAFFSCHTIKVGAAVFSPNSQYILTIGSDKFIKVWDMKGDLIKAWEEENLSDDDTAVFSHDSKRVMVYVNDSYVKIWALIGEVVAEIGREKIEISECRFSPMGTYIAGSYEKDEDDYRVTVWDSFGQKVKTFKGFEESIDELEFSCKEQYLFISNDEVAKVCDVMGKQPAITLKEDLTIDRVCFAPDDTKVLIQFEDENEEGVFEIWDIPSSKCIYSGFLEEDQYLAFSRDSRYYFVIPDNEERKNEPLQIFDFNGRPIAFSDSNFVQDKLASACKELIITEYFDGAGAPIYRLWTLFGQELYSLLNDDDEEDIEKENGLILSPDGKQLLVKYGSDIFEIWDLDEQSVLTSLNKKNISPLLAKQMRNLRIHEIYQLKDIDPVAMFIAERNEAKMYEHANYYKQLVQNDPEQAENHRKKARSIAEALVDLSDIEPFMALKDKITKQTDKNL